jgi:hypothetical protein
MLGAATGDCRCGDRKGRGMGRGKKVLIGKWIGLGGGFGVGVVARGNCDHGHSIGLAQAAATSARQLEAQAR